MLQAMNTGHDGSLTTVHANSPRDALARLETMVLMAGYDLPTRAIREQVASALNLIVQIERARDGTRHISHLTEVVGMEGDIITLQDIYRYDYADQGIGSDRRPSRVRRRALRARHRPSRRAVRRQRSVVVMRLATRLLVTAALLSTIAVGSFGPSVLAQAPPTTDSLEVILAIDTSASMRPALEAAKAAANEFVVAMPTDVRIGVETFADQVTVLASPTTDRELLRAQIDAIIADGDTALYDLVVGARQHFTPSVDNKVLVVLSDGKDEGSVATLDDAISAVSGIKVETISLTTAETDLASLSALGPVTSADDTTGVSAAFARIAACSSR